MKTISTALAAHLGLSCTTVCVLWKVKRADGTILGFTNHDVDVTYNDGADTVDYEALTGYTPSAVESGSDLGTDNLQVTAFLDAEAITEADLRAGLYNYADIQMRLVNYVDLTMGDLKIRKGTLGQVKLQNGEFISAMRNARSTSLCSRKTDTSRRSPITRLLSRPPDSRRPLPIILITGS
jgi:uncharacterized phage protein (TIGR02218 family)